MLNSKHAFVHISGAKVDVARGLISRSSARFILLGTVFQLGLFLRALRPARTGVRPARFIRALPELLKKKKKKILNFYFFYFLKNNFFFVCFQTADVKMPAKCLQICAHVVFNRPQDQILVVHA